MVRLLCVPCDSADTRTTGSMTKLSWSWPRTLPTLSITPITVNSSLPTAKRLAQRIHPKKKLLDQSVANQADVGAMFRLRGREVAAAIDRREYQCPPWWASGPARLTSVTPLFPYRARTLATRGGANFFAAGASVGNRLHVVEFDFAILQSLDDDVEVGDRERRARNLEDVRCPGWRFSAPRRAFAPCTMRHHGDQRWPRPW